MRHHVVLAFLVGVGLGSAFVAIALLAIGTAVVGMTAMVAKLGLGATLLTSVDPVHALLFAPIISLLALILGVLGLLFFRQL